MSDTEYHQQAKEIAAEKSAAAPKAKRPRTAKLPIVDTIYKTCRCGNLCQVTRVGTRYDDGEILKGRVNGILCGVCGNHEPDIVINSRRIKKSGTINVTVRQEKSQ